MELNKIYNESNLDTMRRMPDNFLHCVVTSPPYWGLRDYGTDGAPWPAVTYRPMPGMPEITVPEQVAQLGLEETPEAFVGHIVHIFREVRRVLREDGTLWLNFGDSYAANRGYQVPDGKHTDVGNNMAAKVPSTLKPKDLVGIPWRVAFALQADGWWLRQDIIWAKPNPMPESVTDRCTKAHEYIFLLTKSSRYYYDAEGVKEGKAAVSMARERRGNSNNHKNINGAPGQPAHTINGHRYRDPEKEVSGRRNRRSVWTIATQGYNGAHFAVFPPALVKPCVLAGSPQKVCSRCGAGYVREVEKTPMKVKESSRAAKMGEYGRIVTSGTMVAPPKSKTLGWLPACSCDSEPGRAVVYDPFGGSGTTAEVANEYGRDWIVSEISPDYVENCTRPRLEKTKQKTLF